MSTQKLLKLTPEEAREIPMVDLAFAVLKNANNPMYYRELMQEIATIKGLSDDEVMQVIAQVYTEINIDGRFACVGNNLWGLKRWYPVERSEDTVGGSKHPRIINDEDDDDLDDAAIFGEEVEDYVSDDEFDGVDEDAVDLFDSDSEELDDASDDLDEELDADELEDEDEDVVADDLEEDEDQFDVDDEEEEL